MFGCVCVVMCVCVCVCVCVNLCGPTSGDNVCDVNRISADPRGVGTSADVRLMPINFSSIYV